MDWLEVSASVGSGLAAFGAAWLALFRPLKQREKQQPVAVDPKEVEKLRSKLSGVLDRIERLEVAQHRSEERLQRAVTDEEFAAHTSSTASTLNSLTEKVGMVTGAVDAWYRGAGTRGK